MTMATSTLTPSDGNFVGLFMRFGFLFRVSTFRASPLAALVLFQQPALDQPARAAAPGRIGARAQIGLLDIDERAAAGGIFPPGFAVAPSDSFRASSSFNGVDLGVAGELARGPWTLEWRAKVALGANQNEAQVNGSTTITAGGVTTTLPGGLLALSSNIGNTTQTRFAAVPDFALKAGYQFAPGWRVTASYELLYWTGVQRAGGLIDTTVNPNLIPPGGGGPARPQAQFDTSSLLAQGFGFGISHEF
jgi:hypothetical protein